MENKFQDILKKGVSFWNEWRKGNPGIVPDLAGVNLSKQNLSRINLSNVNLSGSVLTEAILYESDLRGANLSNSDLQSVNMSKAQLSEANLGKANLNQAFLVDAKLEKCYLRHASLTKANLFGAYFVSADMQECDLREAILYQVNFNNADLTGANFTHANLKEVNLAGANLERSYLSQAILEKSNLSKACLDKANLYKGNLRHADLLEANLCETVLFQADFEGANLEGATFRASNLQEANLKDAIVFRTNFSDTNLSRAHVSGGPFRKLITTGTIQKNLNILNTWGYKIRTDTLTAAQRIHSLLHNPSATQLIPTIAPNTTLCLGITTDKSDQHFAKINVAIRKNDGLPVNVLLPPFLPDNLAEFLRLLAEKVNYILFDITNGSEAVRSLTFLAGQLSSDTIVPIFAGDRNDAPKIEPDSGLGEVLCYKDEPELAVALGKALFNRAEESGSAENGVEETPQTGDDDAATMIVDEPINISEPSAPAKEPKSSGQSKSPKTDIAKRG